MHVLRFCTLPPMVGSLVGTKTCRGFLNRQESNEVYLPRQLQKPVLRVFP